MTLKPGDVILTGTPPGVGCFKKPPVFLKVMFIEEFVQIHEPDNSIHITLTSIGHCVKNYLRSPWITSCRLTTLQLFVFHLIV